MIEKPDFAHGCVAVLCTVFFVLFLLTLFADRDDFKNVSRWEIYGIKVIRSQPSDFPVLQSEAQKLLEKDRK